MGAIKLIQTKLVPPLEAGALVTRPRLLDGGREIIKSRLTLVQAPAGYGKSSLLAQWYHFLRDNDYAVAWLSLEESDRDPLGFLTYIAAALSSSADRSISHAAAVLLHNERFLTPN